jgi:lipid-A-disaccharide synthase
MKKTFKIFIIAGEASGDQLGAEILKSLKTKYPDCNIRGIGGERMLAAGLVDSFFPMEELSIMGIVEILPKIPHILRRIQQTVEAIKVFDPDVVLTIDSPDFSFRVQKSLKAKKITAKLIHMVAPSVWAWRPKRAEKIAKFLDGLICLFPFEVPYFTKVGLKTISCGHPVLESGVDQASGESFRFQNYIGLDQPTMGLFFGSRASEVKNHGSIMCEAAVKIAQYYPDIQFIVPTLGRREKSVRTLLQNYGLKALVVTDPEQKWNAMKACQVAIAVSGTIGLELAVAAVPHAVLYKMSPVTWTLLSPFFTMKFAHLGNVIHKKLVIEEFLQDRANPDLIANTMIHLLKSDAARVDLKNVFADLRRELQNPNNKPAADEAADFILSLSSKN